MLHPPVLRERKLGGEEKNNGEKKEKKSELRDKNEMRQRGRGGEEARNISSCTLPREKEREHANKMYTEMAIEEREEFFHPQKRSCVHSPFLLFAFFLGPFFSSPRVHYFFHSCDTHKSHMKTLLCSLGTKRQVNI